MQAVERVTADPESAHARSRRQGNDGAGHRRRLRSAPHRKRRAARRFFAKCASSSASEPSGQRQAGPRCRRSAPTPAAPCSMRPSMRPRPGMRIPLTCLRRPRGVQSSSEPARGRPPWRKPSRTAGRTSLPASSSLADGHAVPCERIEIVEASHPVPDPRGPRSCPAHPARSSRAWAQTTSCWRLISGGGSSLLTLPAPGFTLADKRAVNTALLRSGARDRRDEYRRASTSPPSRVGASPPRRIQPRVVTLVISDVPGDDPAMIASGPTVEDPSTFADARGVLEEVRDHGAAIRHRAPRTRVGGDAQTWRPPPCSGEDHHRSRRRRCRRSGRRGGASGRCDPLILGDALEGEAREVGRVMAGIARQAALRGQPAPPPLVLPSGGETTVTVKGTGRGGRNVEFLLSLGVALEGLPGVYALAGDTDGVDGARRSRARS